MAVSVLVGLPSLKLKGHYLAMATLGFGIILSILFTETVEITGGPSGFVGIPRLTLFGWELSKDLTLYRAVAVILCLIVWLAFNLLHSRVGRALRALHTSEKAAQAMGVTLPATSSSSLCSPLRFRPRPGCSTPISDLHRAVVVWLHVFWSNSSSWLFSAGWSAPGATSALFLSPSARIPARVREHRGRALWSHLDPVHDVHARWHGRRMEQAVGLGQKANCGGREWLVPF